MTSLMALLLLLACNTPKEGTQQIPDSVELEVAEMIIQDSLHPSYIVTDSVKLAIEEFSAVDNMAKGIKERGAPSCIFLNVKGLKLEGGVNVSFDVFINKIDANPETGIESPHYVDTVSIGHAEASNTSFDLKISLDKAIEKMGETLVNELTSGKLFVTMVAFPYSSDLEDLEKVSFTVEQFSLTVTCD